MRKADGASVLKVVELRERYLRGDTTPQEVIHGILERAAMDRDMNIWITPPSLDRIQPYLDGLAHLDPATAPLWGIPFAVKDNIDVAGLETTAACPGYAYTPKEHAVVVERLVAAGAVPVGKTNMDQFATGLVGTRSPFGETHNALRPELISGGSSSGSAVAVARGHAAFTLGTDTAGSGRVPAALNGLFGYKPSIGAWPTQGVVPACASLDCVTVFAHGLEDVLAVDEVVRGVCETDPWSRGFAPPVPARPHFIAVPLQTPEFFGPFAAEYRTAWEAALRRLRELQVPVTTVDVEFMSQAAATLYEGPFVAERWADLGDFVESNPGATLPVTEQILRTGSQIPNGAPAVFRAMHQLQAFKLQAERVLQDAVLVMPTAGGTWRRDDVRIDPVSTNRDLGRYTNHCNLLDLCAVAIPAGEAALGLPFGITFFGLAESEGLIFGAAQLFDGPSEGAVVGTVSDGSDGGKTGATGMGREGRRCDTTLVAVCGLHMRGFPLEKQMLDCGATFIRATVTAPKYRLVKMASDPPKPGMIRLETGGAAIEVEVWEIPLRSFGSLVSSIPAPLAMGRVELDDGAEVSGFICEAYAGKTAEDITEFGGWRRALASSPGSWW